MPLTLSQLSIKKILIVQIFSVLILFVVIGAYSLTAFFDAQKRFDQVETNDLPSIVNLSAIHNEVYNLRINAYRHLITTSPEQKQAFEDIAKSLRVKIGAELESYLQNDATGDDEDQRLTHNDISNFNAYLVALDKFFAFSRNNDMAGASSILFKGGELSNIAVKIESGLSEHQAYNVRLADTTKELNDNESRKTAWVMIAILTITILIFTVLSLCVFFIIKRGLTHLQHVIDHLSTHLDFTHSFTWHRQDEIGHTINSLSSLVSSVGSALTAVKASETSIASSMQSIVDGNTDLASRTEQQAASLVETAASMTEFTESVRLNAENAKQANKLAKNSAEETEKGNVAVNKMISSINDINRMSKRIAEISTVIEGVAFQTNILALNAAVEAARAGEQGRGFAVVAGEVRTLAQRSSGAAKEIKSLVDESVDLFDISTRQAELADTTINVAKSSVDKLSILINDISIASSEQSTGIEQVNIAIHQLDTVTQQNSRLVLDSSTATQSLSGEMKHLQDAVARFTLGTEREVDSDMKRIVPSPAKKVVSKPPENTGEWTSF